MTRLLVSLGDSERAWLDRRSAETGIALSELVRQAIRAQQQASEATLEQALASTKGVWRQGDGLKYQRKIRAAW